ncbi:MAG: hypothetical protein MK160_04525 [Rhodobacteraceae bacterium]|nr:hypothetical protein [Paracoccaceae bacterium]
MTPQFHEIGLESRIALERLIVLANRDILICVPGLVPKAPSASPKLVDRGFDFVADLLSFMTAQNIAVRVLVPTPDPVLHPGAHRQAWAVASDLVQAVPDDIQVLCAGHAHRPGRIARWRNRRGLSAARAELQATPNAKKTPEQRRVSRGHVPRTAGLAQSFVVIDGTTALFGGFGFDGAPAVCAEVGGSAAAILKQIFQRDWNALTLVDETPLPRASAQLMPAVVTAQPTHTLRCLRTESKPGSDWYPEQDLAQTLRTLVQAFATAQHRVLIRAQSVSDPDLIAALNQVAQRSNISLRLHLPPGQSLPDALGRAVTSAASNHHDPWSSLIVVDENMAILGLPALSRQALRYDTGTALMFRNPRDVNALAMTF